MSWLRAPILLQSCLSFFFFIAMIWYVFASGIDACITPDRASPITLAIRREEGLPSSTAEADGGVAVGVAGLAGASMGLAGAARATVPDGGRWTLCRMTPGRSECG